MPSNVMLDVDIDGTPHGLASAASSRSTVLLEDGKELVDAIQFLRKGSCLLRLREGKSPLFDFFVLSSDGKNLICISKSNRNRYDNIEIRTIDGIAPMSAQSQPTQTPKSLCFTIVHDEGSKSLSLAALSQTEYLLWTRGLSSLVGFQWENPSDSEMVPQVFVSLDPSLRDSVFFEEKYTKSFKTVSRLHCRLLKQLKKVSQRANKAVYPYVEPLVRSVRKRLMFCPSEDQLGESSFILWRAKNELDCIRAMMK